MTDNIINEIDPVKARQIADDPNWMRIVCMLTRAGGRLFCVALEFKHYKPETPNNNDFLIDVYKWNGQAWLVVSIPIKDKDKAFAIAKETGMKLQHAIPFVMGGKNVNILASIRLSELKNIPVEDHEIFPMKSETVYTVENDGEGKYSMVYKGLAGSKHVEEFEEAEIEKIHNDYRQWCFDNGLPIPGPDAFD